MVVRILSDCRADGRHLPAGKVVDITEPAARDLIALGRAEHSSLTVEDVATATTATDEELAKPARRGRATATPIPTTKED